MRKVLIILLSLGIVCTGGFLLYRQFVPVQKQVLEQKMETIEDGEKTITITRFYTSGGLPAVNERGYHEERNEKSPGMEEIRFSDIKGKPVLNEDAGCAKLVINFENAKHTIITCFGVDGNAIINKKMGCFKMEVIRSGEKVVTSCYDTEGNLVVGNLFGTARTVFLQYPGRSIRKEIRHYGPDGQLMPCKFGPAIEKCILTVGDGREEALNLYFDVNGEPVKFMGIYPRIHSIIDENDNVLVAEIRDFDNNPCNVTLKGRTFQKVEYLSENELQLYNLNGEKTATVKDQSIEQFLETKE